MKNAKAKILLIEDDSFLLNMYSTKFEIEGYDISIAEDGAKGIELARDIVPDIILLDIMMPKMDGFEVLKELKADSATAEIPVVILTNINQRDDVERGMSLGAVDYFIKAHFIPSEIVKKVEKFIKL
jgi:DNA-binding response OmpR family regulator